MNIIKIWSILPLSSFLALAVACSSGSVSSPSGVSATSYEGQVATYKATYGKSDEWENWMLENRGRYESAFSASSTRPGTLTLSFRYDTTPINYSPAWTNEAEHMSALASLAEAAYPGYNFNIVFEGSTGSSYANIIAGIPTNASYAFGNNVYLYYETIFNHEFAHVMNIPHHYDSTGDIGDGQHMPPGETKCIMDRNSLTFCSACKTALGIPLNTSSASAIDAAMSNILSRYPY